MYENLCSPVPELQNIFQCWPKLELLDFDGVLYVGFSLFKGVSGSEHFDRYAPLTPGTLI